MKNHSGGEMITLDGFDFKGKTVFVRIDMNCPVDKDTLKIEPSPRIAAHAKTVSELSEKGAKVVVLAHQGRKGKYDCISLSQHSLLLGAQVKKPVKFVDDVTGEKAKSAIKELKEGQILVLENVRFLDDETKYKTIEENEKAGIVQNLSSFCDAFVLDAFSVAHRAQASIVGFHKKPVIAGRVMQKELEALNKLKEQKTPGLFIFGGAKPEDSIKIMENWLLEGKISLALCCGVLGELFIMASGKELGKTKEYLEQTKAIEHLEKAKQLLSQHKEKIKFPQDIALDEKGKRKEIPISSLPSENSIKDIGEKTIQDYTKAILSAKTVMMNGPAGVYEEDEFSFGTMAILKAIEKSKAFSVLGGGHTLSAIDKFKTDKGKLGYVSLAGKALIEYLSGKQLPGVKILG